MILIKFLLFMGKSFFVIVSNNRMICCFVVGLGLCFSSQTFSWTVSSKLWNHFQKNSNCLDLCLFGDASDSEDDVDEILARFLEHLSCRYKGILGHVHPDYSVPLAPCICKYESVESHLQTALRLMNHIVGVSSHSEYAK